MDLVALAKNPAAERGHDRDLQVPRRHQAALCALGADAPARGAARCACSMAAASSSRNTSRWSPTCAGAASRVATMDWRGQGGSARMLCNPNKGYVRSFAEFDQDLAHFMKEIVLPDCQPPFIAARALDGRPHPAAQCLAAGLVVLAHGA